jgi:lysozyme
MQISHNGIESLKQLEGFRDKAYIDTGGVLTIGYGSTSINGQPVQPGQTITKAEAELALVADLAWAQTTVNQLVRVPLKQQQFDALTSFVYNVGANAFRTSTMLLKLNQKDYEGAAKEFDKWVYDNRKVIPGLVSRRRIERGLFES